jgi:hypothetical protein
MNTNRKTFCRDLTAAERKELKKVGEIDGIDNTAPLLSWCQKKAKDRDFDNAIYFFEVWANSLISAPMLDYVATVDGIVIAMQTAGGAERLYHFEESEYAEAIDFYNKLVEALKNNNNF